MPLTKGTGTNGTAGGTYVNTTTPITFSHNQNTGADGHLIVMITLGTGNGTVSSVTYNGVAMSLKRVDNVTYPSQHRMYIYELDAPATGAHNVVINWGTIPYNYVSVYAQSFTGCSGTGSSEGTSANATSVTDTIAITENSMIMAQAIGGAFSYVIELPEGTSKTIAWTNNVTNTCFGAVSSSLFPAGTKNIKASAGYGTALQSVELIEAVTTTTPTVTTTLVASYLDFPIVSGGNVTSEGGATVTSRGVCWNTSPNPTIANSKTIDGSGAGVFSSTLSSGIFYGITYYYRAYATNSNGTSYGAEGSFTPATTPTLNTVTATSITSSSAISGGVNINQGGVNVSAKGVCWSTSPNPTISNSKTNNGTGGTSFVSTLAPLLPNTTYYYRAYATNVMGTGYGEELSLTTLAAVTIPVLDSVPAFDITPTTATSGGNTISAGGGTISAKGVCWSSVNVQPTISDSKTNDGTGTADFSSFLTGLLPNTNYYYRAYATNEAGTGYSTGRSFSTLALDFFGQHYIGMGANNGIGVGIC